MDLESFILKYSFTDEKKGREFLDFLNGDWESCEDKIGEFIKLHGKSGMMKGVLKKLCGVVRNGWLVSLIERFPFDFNLPILGDLHIHSDWSDGLDDVESIVKEAERIGLKYIAITDHTLLNKGRVQMDVGRFIRRNELMDEVQRRHPKIKLLKGLELDINEDGSLDYPDEILKICDFVIGAVHFDYGKGDGFRLKLMERMAENEHVDAICHPLDGVKDIDEKLVQRVLDISERYSKPLELNLFPSRLYQNELLVKHSKGRNVLFYFGTDSHSLKHLEFIFFANLWSDRIERILRL